MLTRIILGCLIVTAGVAQVQARTLRTKVDTSMEGIFNAVSSSRNLQQTVDKLTAAGAKPGVIVAIAAAAGVPYDTLKDVDVCSTNMNPESGALGITCLKPNSLITAYQEGTNDPLKYLPATAAGNLKKNNQNY